MDERILNMKKNYFQPRTRIINASGEQILSSVSGTDSLNALRSNPDAGIKSTSTTYDGEFGAKGFRYWDL